MCYDWNSVTGLFLCVMCFNGSMVYFHVLCFNAYVLHIFQSCGLVFIGSNMVFLYVGMDIFTMFIWCSSIMYDLGIV